MIRFIVDIHDLYLGKMISICFETPTWRWHNNKIENRFYLCVCSDGILKWCWAWSHLISHSELGWCWCTSGLFTPTGRHCSLAVSCRPISRCQGVLFVSQWLEVQCRSCILAPLCLSWVNFEKISIFFVTQFLYLKMGWFQSYEE